MTTCAVLAQISVLIFINKLFIETILSALHIFCLTSKLFLMQGKHITCLRTMNTFTNLVYSLLKVSLTLSLLKVIKGNFSHRYEVHKRKHGILYFAQTIADVAISSHNITHTFPIWMVQRICILILGVKEFNQMTDNLCLLYNFLYVLMYACVCVFVVCVCLCMLYVCVFVCCMCGSLWVHFFGWLKKWSNISVSLGFLLWSWSKSEYSKKKNVFSPIISK